MADKKISQLTGASTPLAGSEVLPIVQSGSTVKVSVDNLTKGKTVSASVFDTDVAAAGVTLSGTTLAADGTDTNIDINITPKGTGEVNLPKVDIDAGAIDGTAIGASSASTGAFTTLSASSTVTFSGATGDRLALFDASKQVVSGPAYNGTTLFLGKTSGSAFAIDADCQSSGGFRVANAANDVVYINLLRSGVTGVDHIISGSSYNITNFSNGVSLAAGGTSWGSLSDERQKDIIEPIVDAVEKVKTFRTVIGKYKTDKPDARRAFLIAQDVQKVLPEAVYTTGDSNDTLSLAYTDTIPLLVAAIKEQQEMIDELKAKVAALESK